MKSVIIIFASLLLLIAMPFVFQSIDDAVTQTITQSVSGVATAGGEFADNVTLGQSIYDDAITAVKGISSNISSDTPTAASYNSVSKALEISGLDESQTRTLSISYAIAATNLPTGSELFFSVLFRWFYVFLIIGFTAGAVYAFFD